jgi:glutathione S-transferase
MVTVWGRVNSINVQKVLWALVELNVPYRRIEAGREFGVVTTPEYRRMNPNGLVPTIEDGDLVLWESNAIVRYLYAKYGPPRTPERQAAADKWMDWTTSRVQPPMRTLFWGWIRPGPEGRDLAALEAARIQTADVLTIADDLLATQSYVAGAEFTMGDIPLGCFVNRWYALPVERPPRVHLEAWYGRLQERAGFREHVMLPLR